MQVVFAVEDVSRSVEFYEHAFGWPRNDRIDFEEYVELLPPEGGTLGLYRRDGYARMTHATPAETSSHRASPGKIGSPAASADVHPAGRSLSDERLHVAPEPAVQPRAV